MFCKERTKGYNAGKKDGITQGRIGYTPDDQCKKTCPSTRHNGKDAQSWNQEYNQCFTKKNQLYHSKIDCILSVKHITIYKYD